MKHFLTILFTAMALMCRTIGHSQGFVNLSLNSPNIPAGTTAGSFVPIADAIPGWIGYLGTTQQTGVLYNDLYTGGATLAIIGTNNPFSLTPIAGNNYTVILQAGIGSAETLVSASIAQTAVIPEDAQTILFTASPPYAAGWQLTVAGQVIPVTQISTVGTYYGLYEGNISAFAGQDDELMFTAFASPGESASLLLDGISFSSSPVPEPGVFALVVLRASLLGVRLRKASSK